MSTARYLLFMLERLSADSYWAHQASGLRGSLLKCLEEIETEPGHGSYRSKPGQAEQMRLKILIERGYELLEKAAREILPPKL